MVSGDIADFQIETSSNPAHIIHARAFNSMKAWCPTLDDKERWLMDRKSFHVRRLFQVHQNIKGSQTLWNRISRSSI